MHLTAAAVIEVKIEEGPLRRLIFQANGGSFAFPHFIREIPEKELEYIDDSVCLRDPKGNTVYFAAAKLGGSLEGLRLFETEGYIVALRGVFFRFKRNPQGNYRSPSVDQALKRTLSFDNSGGVWGHHHDCMFIVQLN